MSFLLLLLITIFLRIGFDVAVSKTGGRINDFFANGIISTLAGVIPLLIYLFINKKDTIPTTKSGVIYSAIAGLFVGAFTIMLVRLFERGENLSVIVPSVYGGTLVGATIIGWLFFKEDFSFYGLAGLLMISAGVGLVLYSRSL